MLSFSRTDQSIILKWEFKEEPKKMSFYDESLLLKVPDDYDVKKIGFILLNESFDANGSMDIDYELTPEQPKPIPPTMCHICHRIYMNRSNLRRHLNTVHSTKTFSCEICNQTFEKQRQLSYHMKTHKKRTNLETASYNCDTCGRQEITKSAMIQHMEVHRGIMGMNMDIDILLSF